MAAGATSHEFTHQNGTYEVLMYQPWAVAIQTVTLTITTLFVITGNIVCFLVLMRTRDGNEVTRLCMLSLTATDIGVGFLVCIPITGATAVNYWPYGDAFCLGVAGGTILLSLGGIFVVAVNVERYVAIVWPLRSVTYVTIPRARFALGMVWIVGGIFCGMYCFLPGRKAVYHPHFHTCFVDPEDPEKKDVFGVMAAWIFAIVPFLTTLILYSHLYLIARRHARQISVMEVGHLNNRRVIKKSDLKTATTFFIITAVLAFSWLPFSTVICYEGLTRHEAHPLITFTSEILLLSNSYWNIVIYYFRNEKFRQAGRKSVRQCFRRGGRSRDNEIEATSRVVGELPHSGNQRVVITPHF
ncbi:histamine H2 receptor-like [Asterias rubens]|uniref:histamine H2 receptor-like n=1 Tax=Asterias rubens TaxID=7604 RepID=UPI00145565E8|nr:histamine H2 receptor-like [Asterias rubens]